MRALVLAAGEGSRLPGPVPKPFRLLAGTPVVARIVASLTAIPEVERVDVIVRHEHELWASLATMGWCDCDLLPRGSASPARRIYEERGSLEELLVVNGDTLIQEHARWLAQLIIRIESGPHRPRILTAPASARLWRQPQGIVLKHRLDHFIDVGAYFLPRQFAPLEPTDRQETMPQWLLAQPEGVGSVPISDTADWYDIGTPERFAAAELRLSAPGTNWEG